MKACTGKARARRLCVGAILGIAVVVGVGAAVPGVEAAVPLWGPVDPPAYREETVTIGQEPWELEGILTLPGRVASFPGVVLVADFGPFDRDATTGPDKPFRDLARGLAEHGIASLRYDKRAAIYGPKMDGNALTVEEDVIVDSLAAVSLLKEQEGVEAVFVLGHGLGATLGPEIARRAGADGAILLAPFVTPLDELVLRQLEKVFAADGSLGPAEEDQLERARASVEQFRRGQADPPQTFLGPSRYFVDLRRRDPLREANQYAGPMLILQGGRDEQVPPSEHQLWRQALGHRSDVTFHLFPDLNHAFALGPDPSPAATYRWPRRVNDQVIDIIGGWILAHAPATPLLPPPEASVPGAGPGSGPEVPAEPPVLGPGVTPQEPSSPGGGAEPPQEEPASDGEPSEFPGPPGSVTPDV